jgi:hypothetical protein
MFNCITEQKSVTTRLHIMSDICCIHWKIYESQNREWRLKEFCRCVERTVRIICASANFVNNIRHQDLNQWIIKAQMGEAVNLKLQATRYSKTSPSPCIETIHIKVTKIILRSVIATEK